MEFWWRIFFFSDWRTRGIKQKNDAEYWVFMTHFCFCLDRNWRNFLFVLFFILFSLWSDIWEFVNIFCTVNVWFTLSRTFFLILWIFWSKYIEMFFDEVFHFGFEENFGYSSMFLFGSFSQCKNFYRLVVLI